MSNQKNSGGPVVLGFEDSFINLFNSPLNNNFYIPNTEPNIDVLKTLIEYASENYILGPSNWFSNYPSLTKLSIFSILTNITEDGTVKYFIYNFKPKALEGENEEDCKDIKTAGLVTLIGHPQSAAICVEDQTFNIVSILSNIAGNLFERSINLEKLLGSNKYGMVPAGLVQEAGVGAISNVINLLTVPDIKEVEFTMEASDQFTPLGWYTAKEILALPDIEPCTVTIMESESVFLEYLKVGASDLARQNNLQTEPKPDPEDALVGNFL